MPSSRQFEKSDREIVVIAHNIRSILNVGSILRTAENFGVARVFATGYTPNFDFSTDGSAKILPHVKEKLRREIRKSALGAENLLEFSGAENLFELIEKLRAENYRIVGLEQNPRAKILENYQKPAKIALILGEETRGLTEEIMNFCDDLLEISLFGKKESLNVAIATGIALYELTK